MKTLTLRWRPVWQKKRVGPSDYYVPALAPVRCQRLSFRSSHLDLQLRDHLRGSDGALNRLLLTNPHHLSRYVSLGS
jgi:hypothetical protein